MNNIYDTIVEIINGFVGDGSSNSGNSSNDKKDQSLFGSLTSLAKMAALDAIFLAIATLKGLYEGISAFSKLISRFSSKPTEASKLRDELKNAKKAMKDCGITKEDLKEYKKYKQEKEKEASKNNKEKQIKEVEKETPGKETPSERIEVDLEKNNQETKSLDRKNDTLAKEKTTEKVEETPDKETIFVQEASNKYEENKNTFPSLDEINRGNQEKDLEEEKLIR